MALDADNLVALSLSGWGVLFSVSLGWSFYSLLDQYPRLIRFGSIWRSGGWLRKGTHIRVMLTGWLVTLALVLFSLCVLVWGAFRFGSAWSCSDVGFGFKFLLSFSLVGLAVFLIPVFINRAVWGWSLYCCPKFFKDFVEDPNNRLYWEQRFSIETMQKLWSDPRRAGIAVGTESVVIIVILSWAVSGWFPGTLVNLGTNWWFFAPWIALAVALVFHVPWPDKVQMREAELPIVLRNKFDRHGTR